MATSPTLLIGLGGTGKEVLLRVRRRFFESGYRVQPWISYLWIDTAVRVPAERWARGMPHDYVARRTALRDDDEIVDVGVTPDEARAVLDTPREHRNIWQWADPDLVKRVVSEPEGLTSGAKQIPPLGRLALFLKADQIVTKLQTCAERLAPLVVEAEIRRGLERAQLPRDEERQLIAIATGAATSTPRVIVVGSLAGGTGAGMCIDIAAMLAGSQPLFSACTWLDRASRWGYFLLPEAFCADVNVHGPGFDDKRVRANGYALLQELELLSLDRKDSAQFLTGRVRAGQIQGTWLHHEEPADAHWIAGPIYQSCLLFDGSGGRQGALSDVRDSYELIATLIHSDLSALQDTTPMVSDMANVVYAHEYGHHEVVPRGADEKDRIWTDVYSFRFGAAGAARVTYEAPRLRLMAAYTLAAESLKMALGEEDPWYVGDAGTRTDETIERENRVRQLTASVAARVKFELEQRGTAGARRPWREVWESGCPWPALERARTTSRTSFESQFCSLRDEAPAFNEKAMADSVREDLLTPGGAGSGPHGQAPRFDEMLRSMVNASPLAGFSSTEMPEAALKYTAQGGVGAATYAVGKGSKLGSVMICLDELVQEYTDAAEKWKARVAELSSETSTSCKRADDIRDLADQADGDFWVNDRFFGTRQALAAERTRRESDAREKLSAFGEARYYQCLYGSASEAYRRIRRSQELVNATVSWSERLETTSKFLIGLLRAPGSDEDACGIEVVLDQMRHIRKDALTRHCGEDIQKNPRRLWREIVTAYDNNEVALRQALHELQRAMLVEWADLLREQVLHEQPPAFRSVVDLAALVIPGQHPVKHACAMLPLETQTDRLLELAKAKTKADEVPKGAHLITGRSPDAIEEDIKWVVEESRRRLDVPEDVHRRPETFRKREGGVRRVEEHRYVIGPRGSTPSDPKFKFVETSNPLEIRAVRYELNIPLPNVRSLKKAAAEAASYDAAMLHFTHPKTGYLPVHALESAEATSLRKRYVDGVLAVVLGQFRPNRPVPGADGCFVLHADPISGPQPLSRIRSTGDILRALGEGGNLEKDLDRIAQRNREILDDLGPYALMALNMLVYYNVRFVARQEIRLQESSEVQAAGGTSGYSVRVPGPHDLVLRAAQDRIADVLSRRFRLTVYPTDFSSPQVLWTMPLIEDFLHHFAFFVPVNLARGAEDGVRLLCLSAELDKIGDVAKDDDLLLRRPPRPGTQAQLSGRLGLRAPWCKYSRDTALETLKHHQRLVRADDISLDVSLNPNVADEASARPRPTEWTLEMYVSEAAVKESGFYRTLFKQEVPATQSDAWAELEAARLQRAQRDDLDSASLESNVTPRPVDQGPPPHPTVSGVGAARHNSGAESSRLSGRPDDHPGSPPPGGTG